MNSRLRLSQIEALLEAGWAVTPGAWWDEEQLGYRCGLPFCSEDGRGLHPVGGELRPVTDTSPWQHSPATVLLITGLGIDVVEVDLRAVRLEAGALDQLGRAGPVVLHDVARPRLMIPVAAPVETDSSSGSFGGLAQRTGVAGVTRHGAGSWVALPPARLRGGPRRWVTSPRSVGWVLPDLAFVLDVVATGSSVDPGRDLLAGAP